MAIKIILGKDFLRNITQVCFVERDRMQRIVYNFYTGETQTLREAEAIDEKFILKISNELMHELLKGMADLLEEERVQTDSQAKIEGKLDATKYHLEDLRNLLKLK